jgi:hypothetical protein
MTDQVLDVLKLVLLALLYVFFARVLWAVWSEVRQPTNVRVAEPMPQPAPTPSAGVPTPTGRRETKPPKGRRGTPGRLVTLEPKERRGTAFAITGPVTIGRETDNTIVIIDDAYISSRHATISVADGHVVIDDLGSRNGTYLNGTRLTQRQTVHTGDRVQVGYTVLEAQ